MIDPEGCRHSDGSVASRSSAVAGSADVVFLVADAALVLVDGSVSGVAGPIVVAWPESGTDGSVGVDGDPNSVKPVPAPEAPTSPWTSPLMR